jgi:hypothetical protein
MTTPGRARHTTPASGEPKGQLSPDSVKSLQFPYTILQFG